MRKLIWLATLLALGMFAGAASAQNAALNGYCTLGATSALVSGLSSTNKLQGVIPKCTVTVYLTGTTTKPSIFSDATGTPLGNPFTANITSGQWLFYAGAGQTYDVVLSGGVAPNTYPAPVTLTGVSGGGSAVGYVQFNPLGSQTITQPANTSLNAVGTENVTFDATALPSTTVQPDLTRTPFGVAVSWPYEFVTMIGIAPSQIYTYNISTNTQIAVGSPTGITSCASALGIATTNISGVNILAVFCGDTATLYTYNISTNGALTPLGSVAGLASTISKNMVIDGTDVYIPLSGTTGVSTGSVAKVSIATPASPSVTTITAVASYAFGGSNAFQNPATVQVAGNYVYVNTGNSDGSVLLSNTLQVLNKTTMALVGSPLPINHSSQRLAVQGSTLFLTTYDLSGGFSVFTSFDISNPTSPAFLQKLSVASCHEEAISVRANIAYIGCYDNAEKTIKQLDISNPANMRVLNTFANFNFPEAMTQNGLDLIVTSSSSICGTCGFVYLAHTQGLYAQQFSTSSGYAKYLAAQTFSTGSAAVTGPLSAGSANVESDLVVQRDTTTVTLNATTSGINSTYPITATNTFVTSNPGFGIGSIIGLCSGISGGAHCAIAVGHDVSDGNFTALTFKYDGANSATNTSWWGIRNIVGANLGFCVSNSSTGGFGYMETADCPTGGARFTINGSFAASSIVATGITASTSPICPNGAGGAFTTSGCTGGGGGGTTFTIASGCGTTTSLTGGALAGSFVAGSTSCNPVITMGVTASHGFACFMNDITTAGDSFVQTGLTTTTATFQGSVLSGDLINFSCTPY